VCVHRTGAQTLVDLHPQRDPGRARSSLEPAAGRGPAGAECRRACRRDVDVVDVVDVVGVFSGLLAIVVRRCGVGRATPVSPGAAVVGVPAGEFVVAFAGFVADAAVVDRLPLLQLGEGTMGAADGLGGLPGGGHTNRVGVVPVVAGRLFDGFLPEVARRRTWLAV
jgi:hypothetical protein